MKILFVWKKKTTKSNKNFTISFDYTSLLFVSFDFGCIPHSLMTKYYFGESNIVLWSFFSFFFKSYLVYSYLFIDVKILLLVRITLYCGLFWSCSGLFVALSYTLFFSNCNLTQKCLVGYINIIAEDYNHLLSLCLTTKSSCLFAPIGLKKNGDLWANFFTSVYMSNSNLLFFKLLK